MKYYGYDTKQEFIQEIYDCEIDISYKEVGYIFGLDGRGYCVGATYLKGKELSKEEMDKTIVYADTVEELIDKFVLYDGAKFSDVLELDVKDYDTMELVEN
ncbi:hypothetical protein [Ruminococcus sp.]|uniref:hypothetical protein n=1 Tax=Ruminococcus sp. TaxID=41978 RepID=UPI00386BB0F2